MRFLKIIVGFLCIIVIIFSLIFVLLKIRNNFFDEKFRYLFTQSPAVRKILGFHDYGDGQSDYLSTKRFNKLLVEIDFLDGYKLTDETVANLKGKLKEVCRKSSVEVQVDDIVYESQENFSTQEIQELEKVHRDYWASNNQAVLYILALTSSKEKPTSVGSTFSETGITIFKKTIEGISDLVQYQKQMEESTIYHEFGHLLGLEHSDSGVMAERVEVVNEKIGEDDLWFSEEDLAKIEGLREEYK